MSEQETKLQEMLRKKGTALYRHRGPMNVFVVALYNREQERNGKYQIQLSNFLAKPYEVTTCESYTDLVTTLLTGEADSDEWE